MLHSFLIGLLTVLLVADCVILIGLVLLQLPKKEAGAGVAFGGATTDALFGAGSGANMLTKITKYAAGAFFVMALLLTYMGSVNKTAGLSPLQQELSKSTAPAKTATPAQAPSAPAAKTPAAQAPSTNK